MVSQHIIGQERQNQILNYQVLIGANARERCTHPYAIPLYPGLFFSIPQISVTGHLALYTPRSQGHFAMGTV